MRGRNGYPGSSMALRDLAKLGASNVVIFQTLYVSPHHHKLGLTKVVCCDHEVNGKDDKGRRALSTCIGPPCTGEIGVAAHWRVKTGPLHVTNSGSDTFGPKSADSQIVKG